jgi:hypothetical protein
MLFATLIGPYLTPMDWRWSALAGAILGERASSAISLCRR